MEREKFEAAWAKSESLTPRQAYALAAVLDGWADTYMAPWLECPDGPLHEVQPFDRFDLRVMMAVAENRAWVEAVRQRCYTVAEEIGTGVLPFDRPGPLIDEVLINVAIDDASELLESVPELFEKIPPQLSVEDAVGDVCKIGDSDWDGVSDFFEERCLWSDWDVPASGRDPLLLPAFLKARHPFTWFDDPRQ